MTARLDRLCDKVPNHAVGESLGDEDYRDGDYWSDLARDRYEAAMVAEARAIVAGASEKVPTWEHLRILLTWLDGSGAAALSEDEAAMPF